MEVKSCTKCERELPATLKYFYGHKNMKGGLHSSCKECDGHKFKEPRRILVATKPGHKSCSKCERELPETSLYFFKRKRGKNGLMSNCKECYGEKFVKRATYNDPVKKCPSCQDVLPYTNEYFSKSQRTRKGLVNICKKCVSVRSKEHYQLNRDEMILQHQRYYEENKEKVSINAKRYRNANPEKGQVLWQRRRARIKKLPSNFTAKEWRDVVTHFNGECAYCGVKEKLTQDHFIPVKLGGEFTKQNIVPVCITCNLSKGAKVFSEWYPKKNFYCKAREEKIKKFLNYKNNTQQIALL